MLSERSADYQHLPLERSPLRAVRSIGLSACMRLVPASHGGLHFPLAPPTVLACGPVPRAVGRDRQPGRPGYRPVGPGRNTGAVAYVGLRVAFVTRLGLYAVLVHAHSSDECSPGADPGGAVTAMGAPCSRQIRTSAPVSSWTRSVSCSRSSRSTTCPTVQQ